MSRTVDANILLYAVNEDAAEHRVVLELIEALGTGPDLLYLFWPTIMGFLRISTHGAILPAPLSPKEAMTTVRELLIRSARTLARRAPGVLGAIPSYGWRVRARKPGSGRAISRP